jgi:cytochrome c-type biogenesis protein
MEPILAYVAGLLTLINPCILPVLPIVIVSSLQVSKRGPIALAAGLCLGFIAVGLTVTAFGHLVGLTAYTMSHIGAAMMVVFGIAILVRPVAIGMQNATAGVARRADRMIEDLDQNNLSGQFVAGFFLSIAWSPCIGPTLGGAIALASQRQDLLWASVIMAGYATGIATLVLGLAYGTRGLVARYNTRFRGISRYAQPALGLTFVLIGCALFFGIAQTIEGALLRALPNWLIDLSVSF